MYPNISIKTQPFEFSRTALSIYMKTFEGVKMLNSKKEIIL